MAMRTTDFQDIPAFATEDIVTAARTNRNGQVIVTKPRHFYPWLSVNSALLAGACLLLAALAVTMGIVSWHAQYTYVLAVKHQHTASALEALGLDAGAVIFSVLGIALARLGLRAIIERSLVCLSALGSCVMNLLGADLGSPRSVAVYVMPPLLFAAGSDRLIAVIRRSALGPAEDNDDQRSAWRLPGRALLYIVRFAVAPPSTASGVRRMLLNATPLPERGLPPAPPRPAISAPQPQPSGRRPGMRRQTKTAKYLALAQKRHGPLSVLPLERVGVVAAEVAPEVGLHQGSARTALRAAVLAAQDGGRQA
jgi:hypothetical protein